MIKYPKILASIILSLASLASFFSLCILTIGLIRGSETESLLDVAFVPFVVAFVGFLLFGLAGPIFGYLFICVFSRFIQSKPLVNWLSGIISSFCAIGVIVFLLALPNFPTLNDYIDSLVFLIFIIPVVSLSLVIYPLLFDKKTKNPKPPG